MGRIFICGVVTLSAHDLALYLFVGGWLLLVIAASLGRVGLSKDQQYGLAIAALTLIVVGGFAIALVAPPCEGTAWACYDLGR